MNINSERSSKRLRPSNRSSIAPTKFAKSTAFITHYVSIISTYVRWREPRIKVSNKENSWLSKRILTVQYWNLRHLQNVIDSFFFNFSRWYRYFNSTVSPLCLTWLYVKSSDISLRMFFFYLWDMEVDKTTLVSWLVAVLR